MTREEIRKLAADEAESFLYVAIDAPRYSGARCGVYGYKDKPVYNSIDGDWSGTGMTEITFVALDKPAQIDFSQLVWTYEEFFA